MGTITRSFANNITTSGVLLPASLTNNSIANVTAYNASVSTGGMVLLSTQTASNSASISFTTGINSTYKEYQFYLINIHPRTDNVGFTFNLSTDAGSNYNVTKTSNSFGARNREDGDNAYTQIGNEGGLAQNTGYDSLNTRNGLGSGSDENFNGVFQLFNPASTTYVKHYIFSGSFTINAAGAGVVNTFTAGYGNTTSAINAIDFKMNSGNIDGTILMYGIV
jgi:hypothetical protein